MGDGHDLKVKCARGAAPGDDIANPGAQKGAGKGGLRRDAATGGVGLILAHDLIGGLVASGVSDGDGKAEGDLGQVMGGRVDDDGGLQAGLKPADVAFGGGFGQLVQPFGAGAKGWQGRSGGRQGGSAAQQDPGG